MATPRFETGRLYSLQPEKTPHLIHREPNLLSSSSSPMIATPAKQLGERLPPPKWEGFEPTLLNGDVSASSVASTSSQDSIHSSKTSMQPESRPRSTSPMPKVAPAFDGAVHRQRTQSAAEDVGLGFSNNVKFGFQQAAQMAAAMTGPVHIQRGVPATPPPPGSLTPGSVHSSRGAMERILTGENKRDATDGLVAAAQLAADAEAKAQSEAEEAASILVNSVATTPRHHGRQQSLSTFPNVEQDGDHTMSDVFAPSSPSGQRAGHSPAPTLPSFFSSSPPLSSATASREQPGYRSILPTTSPSQMQSQFSNPPSSAQSVSEISLTSAASAQKPKKKSKPRGSDADGNKPPFSYAGLIGQAILAQPDKKLSLNDIYVFIMHHYPFYKKEDAGWQNSIRHNLSLNECFVKKARDQTNPGKGCLWSILDGTEDQFEGGNFVKRSAMGKKKAQAAAATAAAAAAAHKATANREGDFESEEADSTPAAVSKRPRRAATSSRATRQQISREPSEEPSVHSGQDVFSEEGEDMEPTLSEEEAFNSSEEPMLPDEPSRSRKRQRLAPPVGLPLPAYPPRAVAQTSPAYHDRGQTSASRTTRTSPPPYLNRGPLSPPTNIIRRMSNPWPTTVPPKPSQAAETIMSSPGAGGIMPPTRFYPGGTAEGPGFLQAAPLIRPGHRRQTSSARDVRGEDEESRTVPTASVTMSPGSLNTQSPVSSLRSAFQPSGSPIKAKTSSMRGGGQDEEETPMSPPPARSRDLTKGEEERLLRTPPSGSQSTVFSTPRRDTPGRYATPAGWSSSQYDPYDHGGAVTAEVERVGRKGVPPTPKFSTPGMNVMTPW